MKKEKRELTLGQLELRKKTAWKVYNISIILACIAFIAFFVLPLPIGLKFEKGIIVVLSFGFSCVVIIIISAIVLINIEIRINSKKDEMKVKVLKKLAKECDLKKSVTVINEEIITDILSRSIDKIVIDNIEGPNFVTSILLADNTWQSQVYIPAEKLISILDENSKKEMLEYLIKDIKIGNPEGETTEVTILGYYCGNPDFCYYINQKTTDEELLEIFELKEE